MEYVFNIWKCYELCLLMYDLVLNIKLDILKKLVKVKRKIYFNKINIE